MFSVQRQRKYQYEIIQESMGGSASLPTYLYKELINKGKESYLLHNHKR